MVMKRSSGGLAVALWYIRRPMMWGEFARGVSRKLRGYGPDERPAATVRCAEIAVDPRSAMRSLGVEWVDVTELPVYVDARRRLAADGVTIACAGDTSMLYSAVRSLRPEAVLETGVAYGMSSLAILMAMDEVGRGHLHSVDMPYRGAQDDSYVGQAVPPELRNRWTLLRMPDRRGVPKAVAEGQPFDLVHYDSDKTRDGREFALPLLWESLRPGGVLLSDDVNDDFAFLEFADSLGVPAVVWEKDQGGGYAGAIPKSR